MNTTTPLIDRTMEVPQLEDILSPSLSPESTSFIVDSAEKAAWAARKILDAEYRITQYTDQAKQYKQRIDSWFAKAVQEELERAEHLKTLLKPFIEEEIARQPKSKTIHFPSLSVQLRKKPDKVDITDKDIAISFCESNHRDALIIKKELSKTYLKDLLAKKGEIIPGTAMIPGDTDLYIKEE